MALFNEILAGRINRALQKFLSMKGSPPSPQISGEIVPSISLPFGKETRVLEAWNLFPNAWQIAAGGAGNRTGLRFRNPANSGVVAVIEKIWFNVPTAIAVNVSVNLGSATTDLTTPDVVSRPFDKRTVSGSSMSLSHQNVGALPALTAPVATLWAANFSGANYFDVITTDIHEFPVLPGDAIQWDAGVDNVSLNSYIWWRERVLEDSEKSA